ncbi:unnamed protein product, partial [Candidula unifasciata]
MAKFFTHPLFLMLIIGACWLASAKKKKVDADKPAGDKKTEEDSVGTVIGIDLGTTYS